MVERSSTAPKDIGPRRITYAQNFEDVILWRLFGDSAPQTYLDIGAQDPVVDSVSKLFYDAGWRGIHVEANPFFADRLRAARPEEIVIQAAVADAAGPISFFATNENGLSTGCQQVVDEHVKAGFGFAPLKVPVVALDKLLEMAAPDIAWLKVDVEGMELEVLRSWHESPVRPPVVLVEATFPNTQLPSHHDWEPILLSRDYRMVHFDGLSRWYLHEGRLDLLQRFEAGANIFDHFSVGQFHFSAIALNEERARAVQELAGEVKQLEARLAEQHALLRDAESGLAAQRDQFKELRENATTLTREKAELAFQKDKAEAHLSLQLEGLRVELQKKSAEQSIEHDQIVAELNSAQSEVRLLQQRCGDLSSQILAAESDLTAQRDQFKELRENAATLAREKAELAFQKDKGEAHLSLQLEGLRLELQKRSAEQSIEHNRILDELNSAQSELRLLQQRCGDLNSQILTAETAAAEARSQAASRELECENLEHSLQQEKAAVRDLQVAVERSKQSLTGAMADAIQLRARVVQLIDQQKSLELERDGAREQAALRRRMTESMALEHARACAELERAEVALAIQTEVSQRQRSEIAQLSQRLAAPEPAPTWTIRLKHWLHGTSPEAQRTLNQHAHPSTGPGLQTPTDGYHSNSLDEQGLSVTMSNLQTASKPHAIFTIVSNNYLHFARTLLESARQFHPDADVFCVIVDKDVSYAKDLRDEFSVISLSELNLPFGDEFLIQYNVLELNTAVKPWAFEHLMRSYEQVIYIDPDIRLYRRMGEVMDLLNSSHNVVLTPHLLAPIDDDKLPTELDIRRAGTYNFGFCALNSTKVGLNFVKWWQKKLERDCIVDLERGIFVDQSWIDLVPGLFDKVAVLRHPGYNVAYWNLAQRKIEKAAGGRFTVNGEPLVFFHYSGLNPLDISNFSKHQNRFQLRDLGPARGLVEEYAAALLRNGARTYSRMSYGFGRFGNGENIPMFFASLYRAEPELRKALGDKPFERGQVLLQPARVVDGQAVNWAMLGIWQHRGDLKHAFPLDTGESVRAFRSWFAHEGGTYYSRALADRHMAELHQAQEQEAPASNPGEPNISVSFGDGATASAVLESQDLLAKKLMISELFYRNLGRHPEPSAVTAYSKIAAKRWGRLRVWRAVAMSAENRRRRGALGRATRTLFVGERRYTLPPLDATPLADAVRQISLAQTSQSSGTREPVPSSWHQRKRSASSYAPLFFGGIHFEDGGDKDQGIWAGPHVRLPLPPVAPGTKLKVTGFCLPDLLQQQYGSAANEIAVYVGDQCVCVEESDAEGKFCLEGTVDGEHQHSAIEVVARYHIVPKDLGLNDDARELAIRLQVVEVGNHILFDAGADRPQRALEFNSSSAPGINLVGYVRAESGVGEAARSLAAAARAAKIDYHLVDVGFQNPNRQTDESAVSGGTDKRQDINLTFVNADQTPATLRHLQQLGSKARYTVGFWHWEQPVFPKKWLSSFAGLNEIWVPTAFVQEAISALAPVPVVRVPNAVAFDVPKRPRRERFGIPSGQLAVLMMYDFDSYTYRKNPQAAVAAFRLAAKGQKDIVLVVKTINASKHPEALAELKKVAKSLNVMFVDQFLSRSDVYELQACCDVLLSLHRAEGFGLAPAEMMFLGKPVIATGWSGNMDFMTPMNSYPVNYELRPLEKQLGVYESGIVWAEPDVEHAAWCLQEIIKDPAKARTRAARGADDVRRLLSPEAVGAQVRERLNVIARLSGLGVGAPHLRQEELVSTAVGSANVPITDREVALARS